MKNEKGTASGELEAFISDTIGVIQGKLEDGQVLTVTKSDVFIDKPTSQNSFAIKRLVEANIRS